MSNQNPAFDPSIPVLTEVLDEAAAPAPAAADTPAASSQGLAQREVQSWTDADWEALELRLSERILTQLQSRTDFVLEQRVRDAMSDVLQHALKSLTSEIREGLHDTLEKIVARAVTQELTHLKALRK
ncbi:hypothetical protein [Pseudoduganella sp. GCM10020061]|jgi:hypothetical protein|uniref:hypothetical protein n=1 Tax=Pseudoduganella sp. GCM10020061 TaxID=3317345 RepID=UPI003640B8B6